STLADEAKAEENALSLIAGKWKVSGAGSVPSCEHPQVFTVSGDRRSVDLDISNGKDQATYAVLEVRRSRLLMFILGEKRKTARGDPVVWWAVFEDKNRFRWRRTDWPRGSRTRSSWVRC